MASSQSSFFTSSPVVAIPPSQADNYFNNPHYAAANGIGQTPDGINGNPFTPSGSIPPTPGSLAGRKRSRGDIHTFDDEEEHLEDGSVDASINPATMNSSAQFGAQVEDNTARKIIQLSHTKRPSFSSRKSQRKDASAGGADDLAQLVLPPQMREATQEPLIDEATRMLGISWTRMDATESTRINQAAYSRFIKNHYRGFNDVAVWFEYGALPGYLVEMWNVYNGRKEWYIFSQDLTEGRLVTTEPSQLIPRLKMLPALHLAAPGGHIRAEMDAIPAVQGDMLTSDTNGAIGVSVHRNGTQLGDEKFADIGQAPETNGMCSAHAMELD